MTCRTAIATLAVFSLLPPINGAAPSAGVLAPTPALAAPIGAAAPLATVAAHPTGRGADLEPHTLAAFQRYVEVAEARFREQVAAAGPFLWVDHLPGERRRALLEQLRRGEMVMQDLELRDAAGDQIEVEDGLIHHWVGIVFVPGATVEEALALVQDYDRHAEIYAPQVDEARTLERQGDRFTVFMRFRKKKVITVVLDTVHEAVYERPAADRAWSMSHTTSVREVEDAGEPGERRKPEGEGHGFLWRLNSYWRFIERDDGVFVESQSVSLTRDIPFLLRWLVGPFVNDVPRESLEFLLGRTRRELTGRARVAVPGRRE